MSGSTEFPGARILVVDDREMDARLVVDTLRAAGYRDVTATLDPREVCDLYRENRYDLVILDLLMPETDGFAILEQLGAIEVGKYLPVLAVTSDPGLMQRSLEAGAKDFIGKPLQRVEVLARVRNMLEVGSLMKELEGRGVALEKTLEERTTTLRESEDVFRLFAANVPEGMFIRGIEDRAYRYFNPAFEKLMGRRLEVGGSIDAGLASIHPADREVVLEEMRRNPLGGVDREMRFVHPDGSVRWGHARTFPIADSQGKTRWIAGIIEDITQRKVAEEAMREAQDRFRALVEQSIAGIYVVESGRYTYANPRMCEMLGYALEELQGIEIMDLVVEEDRERLAENRRRREAGDAAALIATYRLKRSDGRILHLAVDGRLHMLDARRVLFGIAQDVSERVRAQELLLEAESHYRALVEQSLVGIYIMDKQRIMYANPMLCDLVGFSVEELAALGVRGMVVPEDHHLVDETLRRREAGEMGSIAVNIRVARKGGRVLHLNVESKIIELAGRKAAVGIVQDITERVRAADAIRENQAALESANKRLRSLSQRVLAIQEDERRGISRELHDDVGQSLLVLRMGLHRLEGHVDAANSSLLAQCVGVSDSIQEKLRELSLQLLPPQLEQLGLQDALRWLVGRQQNMTGLAIACRFGTSERFAAEIESTCYRICQEALNNATRHARARSITVELDADGESIILTIRDDGVGFDEKARRAEALVSGSLGLISMEERARLAGGRLELRTAPDAGTTITVYFPLGAAIEQPLARSAVERTA